MSPFYKSIIGLQVFNSNNFCTVKMRKSFLKTINFPNYKHWNKIHMFKGRCESAALPSWHGVSFEITLTVPLRIKVNKFLGVCECL